MTRRKWEYRVEYFSDPDGRPNPTPLIAEYVAWLCQFGEEGWEVYAVFGAAVHMKREIGD